MLPRSVSPASAPGVKIPLPSAATSETRRRARLNPRRRKAATRAALGAASMPSEVVLEDYPTDDSCDATNSYPRSLKATKSKMSKLLSNKSVKDTESPGQSAIAVSGGVKAQPPQPQPEIKPSVAHKMLIRKQEKQIRKLQIKAHDMSLRIDKMDGLIQFKDLQIGIHHVVVETLKGMITCPLCMELMSEAHVLAPCGHLACLNCLYEHFRHKSCLAIRPDQELITGQPGLPDSDIRQRTKLCFMCRTPVLLRPAPLYLAKELIDNLIQARPPRAQPIANKANTPKTLSRPSGDMWRFTFLKDSIRPRWHDEIDDVWRCGCGHEIDGVRCSNGCPGEFDPVRDERYERLVRVDDDGGEEVDSQGASSPRTGAMQASAPNGAGRLSEAALMAHVRAGNGGTVSQHQRPSASMTATVASARAGRAAMARAGIIVHVDDEPARSPSPPPHRRDSEVETEEDSEEDDPEERLSFIAYTDEEEQQTHGNKRALTNYDSDESDADWSEPKRRRIASDDSDESVSDDFVPRSPSPAHTRPAPSTSRARARIVLSSDDE